MTEEKWLTLAEPDAMLEFLRDSPRHRKLRLLACAACRRAWNLFVQPFVIRAIEIAEGFAEGEAADLRSLHQHLLRLSFDVMRHTDRNDSGYPIYIAEAAASTTISTAWHAAFFALPAAALAACDASVSVPSDYGAGSHVGVAEFPSATGEIQVVYSLGGIRAREIPSRDMPREYAEELAAQADLVRDIFGNPFRSSELKSEWLTADVLTLARGMYDSRNLNGMPILADALQDAGCDDEDMLSHCREAREHVRGCWVVDLLLGKA